MMDPMDREALMSPPPGSILTIDRVFDAPRESVWMAWTTPDLIMLWFGPKGYTTPVARVSLRVGGSYFYGIRSAAGKVVWRTGFFREIVPLERLVATDSFADERGNVVPASYYGMSDDYPLEMLLTVTFADTAGKTKLGLEHAGLPAGREMNVARQAWKESLDKLGALLAGQKKGR